MAFSKSKFLTIFLLSCSLLHLGFANEEEAMDNAIAQSDIGQRLPYVQDCCTCSHLGTCCSGGGDYGCNPPCGCGCVENPGVRCCSGSICHSCPPSCQCQGSCPPCGCTRGNVKIEGEHESNSDHPTSESMSPDHEGN